MHGGVCCWLCCVVGCVVLLSMFVCWLAECLTESGSESVSPWSQLNWVGWSVGRQAGRQAGNSCRSSYILSYASNTLLDTVTLLFAGLVSVVATGFSSSVLYYLCLFGCCLGKEAR